MLTDLFQIPSGSSKSSSQIDGSKVQAGAKESIVHSHVLVRGPLKEQHYGKKLENHHFNFPNRRFNRSNK